MVKSNPEKLYGETSSKQTYHRIESRSTPPALAKSGFRGDGSDPDPVLDHFTAALIISLLVQFQNLIRLFQNFSASHQRSLAEQSDYQYTAANNAKHRLNPDGFG
jgi:hypothetical protein